MTVSTWEATLDLFAQRLANQRAALHAGAPDAVAPFAPPPCMGALPPHLRARAEELLQEVAEVQAHLEASLAATGREVLVVRRMVATAAAGGGPRYVDRPL